MEIENNLLLLITLNLGLIVVFSWLGLKVLSSCTIITEDYGFCDDTFAQLTLTYKIPRIMKRYIIRCKRTIDNSDGEEPPINLLFVM